MKKVSKIIVFIALAAVLVFIMKQRLDGAGGFTPISAPSVSPTSAIGADALAAQPSPTATPTPTPEPTPEYFTISCVGDCTLWSSVQFEQANSGLPLTVGENLAYPFSNTVQYFQEDEFTLANLECTLSDTKLYSAQQYYFLAPTSYLGIMTQGGVDFVTTANNHAMDFAEAGFNNTCEALDAAGLPYGTERQSQIVTTKSGLKLGIYTAGVDMRPDWKTDEAVAAVKQLEADGADYVICMFHMGLEIHYSPETYQTTLYKACVDAGADLIYSSHPHCLQPVEEYNGAYILNSLGNWVFGGSTRPTDPDTAILQVTLKRDVDGTISNDSFKAIPCCVSSNLDGAARMADNYNNYCPTPYEEGSDAYNRAMSKLTGEFVPDKEGADYSNWWASWG